MSADLLREAAALMRERAEVATSPPWSSGLTGIYGGDDAIYIAKWDEDSRTPIVQDRLHIASWHPAVALAVADWLEADAAQHEFLTKHGARGFADDGKTPGAFAVARAYLGDRP